MAISVRRFFFLLALVFCASCGQQQTSAPDGRIRIALVTDWKAQAEQGGFYQALAEGLYAARGLDVSIIQGGASVNVPQLLAGGAADFGIGSNAFIPLNMVRQGLKVKAVMAVFQKDPQVLIAHPRRDVHSIADMKGMPILIGDASTVTFWPWLRAKFGFTDSQIRKYTFNLAPFLLDDKAIQEGYLTSEPYLIEREGKFAPAVYPLADAGYPGYANMLLVPERWIEERPQAVQAFVDATIEGWTHYVTGDPSRGNALIKRDNPDMSDDVIAQAIAKMRDYGLVLSGDALTSALGAMTDARWREFYTTMQGQGVYPAGFPYTDAYTLAFLHKPDGAGAATSR